MNNKSGTLNGRKPQDHYFKHGCITFSVGRKDKKLYYKVIQITRSGRSPLFTDEVKDKEMLDKLLGIKQLAEIDMMFRTQPNRNQVKQD